MQRPPLAPGMQQEQPNPMKREKKGLVIIDPLTGIDIMGEVISRRQTSPRQSSRVQPPNAVDAEMQQGTQRMQTPQTPYISTAQNVGGYGQMTQTTYPNTIMYPVTTNMQRPTSAPGMQQQNPPPMKWERKTLQIIDPNTGKDIMGVVMPQRQTPPGQSSRGQTPDAELTHDTEDKTIEAQFAAAEARSLKTSASHSTGQRHTQLSHVAKQPSVQKPFYPTQPVRQQQQPRMPMGQQQQQQVFPVMYMQPSQAGGNMNTYPIMIQSNPQGMQGMTQMMIQQGAQRMQTPQTPYISTSQNVGGNKQMTQTTYPNTIVYPATTNMQRPPSAPAMQLQQPPPIKLEKRTLQIDDPNSGKDVMGEVTSQQQTPPGEISRGKTPDADDAEPTRHAEEKNIASNFASQVAHAMKTSISHPTGYTAPTHVAQQPPVQTNAVITQQVKKPTQNTEEKNIAANFASQVAHAMKTSVSHPTGYTASSHVAQQPPVQTNAVITQQVKKPTQNTKEKNIAANFASQVAHAMKTSVSHPTWYTASTHVAQQPPVQTNAVIIQQVQKPTRHAEEKNIASNFASQVAHAMKTSVSHPTGYTAPTHVAQQPPVQTNAVITQQVKKTTRHAEEKNIASNFASQVAHAMKTSVSHPTGYTASTHVAQQPPVQTNAVITQQVKKNHEKYGPDAEEVKLAVEFADDISVDKWFKEKWLPFIDRSIHRTTNQEAESDQNNEGEISVLESKEALKLYKDCKEIRKKMLKEIQKQGNFDTEDILQAMLHSQGDIKKAIDELNSKRLVQFEEKIWQSDEVDDNLGLDQLAIRDSFIARANDMSNKVPNSILSRFTFQDVMDINVDLERRIRLILVEGKLQSWEKAEIVIKILDEEVASKKLEASLEDVVEAVKTCNDHQSCLVFLKQYCQLCYSQFPMSKIRTLGCECKICVNCVHDNFEIAIREKHVRNLHCPVCSQPDMEDVEAASDYLAFLTLLLQNLVSRELIELFHSKLIDWHLQKDPNFRWCAHCGNGFIWTVRYQTLRMLCPTCQRETCFSCKKKWEEQHEGLSCEEFAQWKIDNDPGNQIAGLARYLEDNGIDCPSCKMKYSLAKGGCMHFKCPQCGFEFCGGCSRAFYQKGDCRKFLSCRNRGLHCHHPRDCLYYLRDENIDDLQKLLKNNKIQFNNTMNTAASDHESCPVMEQKEDTEGQRDEACGREVHDGSGGLCLIHYKEYLVSLINKHNVDPLAIMSIDAMIRLIEREERNVPQKKSNERHNNYKKRLERIIKDIEPLNSQQ